MPTPCEGSRAASRAPSSQPIMRTDSPVGMMKRRYSASFMW